VVDSGTKTKPPGPVKRGNRLPREKGQLRDPDPQEALLHDRAVLQGRERGGVNKTADTKKTQPRRRPGNSCGLGKVVQAEPRHPEEGGSNPCSMKRWWGD